MTARLWGQAKPETLLAMQPNFEAFWPSTDVLDNVNNKRIRWTNMAQAHWKPKVKFNELFGIYNWHSDWRLLQECKLAWLNSQLSNLILGHGTYLTTASNRPQHYMALGQPRQFAMGVGWSVFWDFDRWKMIYLLGQFMLFSVHSTNILEINESPKKESWMCFHLFCTCRPVVVIIPTSDYMHVNL